MAQLFPSHRCIANLEVRLSIAYNDFFGGFIRSKEIIIQGITSGGKDFTRPEEIAHIPIFTPDSTQENLVEKNLAYSALRIEKTTIISAFYIHQALWKILRSKKLFQKIYPLSRDTSAYLLSGVCK